MSWCGGVWNPNYYGGCGYRWGGSTSTSTTNKDGHIGLENSGT